MLVQAHQCDFPTRFLEHSDQRAQERINIDHRHVRCRTPKQLAQAFQFLNVREDMDPI